jgi:hypothetical protein
VTAPPARPAGRRGSPLPRRLLVTLCYVVALLGSAIGVGAFGGTPIADAAGGLLATDATLVAPASTAFSVWTLIYAGLGGYALQQWWDPDDARRVAGPAIVSLLLNAAWILLIQAGQVWLSVVVIVALLADLAVLFRRLRSTAPRGPLERIVVDGTFGVYLGWVCVATCANIAAALTGSGFAGFGRPDLFAVAVLGVAGAIGVALTLRGHGAVAAPAGIVWGLAWIAVARTAGDPESAPAAVTATVAAIAVAAATAVAAGRRLVLAPDRDGR